MVRQRGVYISGDYDACIYKVGGPLCLGVFPDVCEKHLTTLGMIVGQLSKLESFGTNRFQAPPISNRILAGPTCIYGIQP